MRCIFIDYGSISTHDGAICRDVCLKFIFCDLIFVRDCCEAPDHTYRNLTCLKVLLQDVQRIDSSVFCHLCPEIKCRIKVIKVSAKCISRCNDCCLCVSAIDISECYRIITIFDVCPWSRCIFYFICICKEGCCTGISDHPFSVFAFCPIRNAIPVGSFVSLYQIFIHCLCTKCLSDIADVLCSFFAFCLEHLKFLCGRHVRVSMCDTIFIIQVLPGQSPVCPGIRHTDRFYITFFFCFCSNIIQCHRIQIHCICCKRSHRTYCCSC